jgi:hypothetical protein
LPNPFYYENLKDPKHRRKNKYALPVTRNYLKLFSVKRAVIVSVTFNFLAFASRNSENINSVPASA